MKLLHDIAVGDKCYSTNSLLRFDEAVVVELQNGHYQVRVQILRPYSDKGWWVSRKDIIMFWPHFGGRVCFKYDSEIGGFRCRML